MALQRRNTAANASASVTKTPAKSASADPFAAKFNQAVDANPAPNFENLPVGAWDALAIAGGFHEKDGKESAWIDYRVCQEGAPCFGQKGRTFFTLLNEDGEMGIGAAILARNLTDMGVLDGPITSKKHLETLLEGLATTPVWVEIRVTVKMGYTNIRLQRVHENQQDAPVFDDIPA